MMDYLPPRVINVDGCEGDMLNLVFVAQPEDLEQTFARAGWVHTDDWKPIFVWHLLRHRNHDAQLPMARFFLFGRVQDYSYALPDPNAIVTRRHHLRIWKTDYTIDGTPIWAAAASHDVAIVIGKRGHLINHRIDPNVDAERDFVGSNLTGSLSVSQRAYLHSSKPVLQAQTSSGDSYHSDGRLLLLDIPPTSALNAGVQRPSSSIVRATSEPGAVSAEPIESDSGLALLKGRDIGVDKLALMRDPAMILKRVGTGERTKHLFLLRLCRLVCRKRGVQLTVRP